MGPGGAIARSLACSLERPSRALTQTQSGDSCSCGLDSCPNAWWQIIWWFVAFVYLSVTCSFAMGPGGYGRRRRRDPSYYSAQYRDQQVIRILLALAHQIMLMERKPPVTLLLAAGRSLWRIVRKHHLFRRAANTSFYKRVPCVAFCDSVNVLFFLRPEGIDDLVPTIRSGCLNPSKIIYVSFESHWLSQWLYLRKKDPPKSDNHILKTYSINAEWSMVSSALGPLATCRWVSFVLQHSQPTLERGTIGASFRFTLLSGVSSRAWNNFFLPLSWFSVPFGWQGQCMVFTMARVSAEASRAHGQLCCWVFRNSIWIQIYFTS